MDLQGFNALYQQWIDSPGKESLTTELIRKAFAKEKLDAGLDKAHWLDLELATHALKHMPGPKPSKEYILTIAETLKDPANWRPLGSEKNRSPSGIERETVNAIIAADENDTTVLLDGHKLGKVKHQIKFLVENQKKLPEKFVNKLTDMLKNVRDPVDRRKHLITKNQVSTAGNNFLETQKNTLEKVLKTKIGRNFYFSQLKEKDALKKLVKENPGIKDSLKEMVNTKKREQQKESMQQKGIKENKLVQCKHEKSIERESTQKEESQRRDSHQCDLEEAKENTGTDSREW